MLCYLYQITLPNGRGYIGVALNPRKRFKEHCRSSYNIGKAIREFDVSEVSFIVLACGTQDYIYDLEARAIKAFATQWPSGLNMAGGGFGGRNPHPSTRAKQSKALRGRKFTPEHCANMAAARVGTSRSLESRQRQAAAKKGQPWSAARRAAYDPVKALAAQKRATDAPRSAETLARLLDARKRQSRIRGAHGQWASPEGRA
jgi:predicted GIY-YIG superfamily endonuclease